MKNSISLKIKFIYFILTFLYAIFIISNWIGIIDFANSSSLGEAVGASNLIYQIIIIILLVLSVKRIKYFFIYSLLVSLYGFIFLPTAGFKTFTMSWYALVTGNYQAAIFSFCTYMIPIVSAIGLFIWYSDRNKKVSEK